ncbi:MAG: DUF6515 family protein [Leptothrix sp. (in: b-proteobacteria)]
MPACHAKPLASVRRAFVLITLLGAALSPVAGWAQHGGGRHMEFDRQLRVLPYGARIVPYGSMRYGYHGGYWYAPDRGGYRLVRPPYGVVVGDLPAFATVLTIGAVTYWYANDIYYRAAPSGGYEVVAPPVTPPMQDQDKLYIYPNQGQSAEQQATDEYDCHRWAVSQSGFDPTAAATGTSATTDGAARPGSKADYSRAQSACLEGRGYTVR